MYRDLLVNSWLECTDIDFIQHLEMHGAAAIGGEASAGFSSSTGTQSPVSLSGLPPFLLQEHWCLLKTVRSTLARSGVCREDKLLWTDILWFSLALTCAKCGFIVIWEDRDLIVCSKKKTWINLVLYIHFTPVMSIFLMLSNHLNADTFFFSSVI